MARAEIYINSTLADYEKLDLSFVYACEDDNLGVSGSHSKRTIKLPATKTNNEIFDNAIRIQLPQNLSSGLLTMPCRILVDGLVVFIGKCQVDKSTISRLNSNYEVLFLADNSDWIEEFRNVGLDQIPMPTTIDYTGQNVLDFYGGHNKFNGFCFFLPKTAEWQRTGSVRTDEYYPAIFIDYIFRKAFSNIGYTINSDFFDTTFWSGLILPVLCRNYDTEWIQSKVSCQLGVPDTSVVSILGYSAWFWVNFNNIVDPSGQMSNRSVLFGGSLYYITQFRPKTTGKFKFNGWLYEGTTVEHDIYFLVNGALQTTPQGRAIKARNGTIDLKVGDIVEFIVDNVQTPNTTFFTGGFMHIDYVSLVSTPNVPNVTIGNFYPFNAIYDISQLAKSWKLLDIIKDIQKAFNLVFVTDAVKKEVTIEPRDYWISAADGVLFNGNGIYSGNEDITAKVDVSKDILQEYNSDEERYISINYKEDDPTVKAFEAEREGIKLYSYKFDRGARFKNAEKQVNLEFFNKCMHIIDSEINPTSTSHLADYQLPLLYGKNWYETPRGFFPDYDNLTPYLLWFYGNYNPVYPPNEGASGISVYDPITNYSARRGFPLAFITLYNDYSLYSDYSANLSFSKEGYSHSLVSDFHYRDFERKTNNVKVTAYVNWSNIDIFNLDFKKKYVLNESTMLLKSVDGYNPLSGTTTKTVLQLDGRLMSDGGETGTEENESKLKGLIVI